MELHGIGVGGRGSQAYFDWNDYELCIISRLLSVSERFSKMTHYPN